MTARWCDGQCERGTPLHYVKVAGEAGDCGGQRGGGKRWTGEKPMGEGRFAWHNRSPVALEFCGLRCIWAHTLSDLPRSPDVTFRHKDCGAFLRLFLISLSFPTAIAGNEQ